MSKPDVSLAQLGVSLMGLGCFVLFGLPILFFVVVILLAAVGVI